MTKKAAVGLAGLTALGLASSYLIYQNNRTADRDSHSAPEVRQEISYLPTISELDQQKERQAKNRDLYGKSRLIAKSLGTRDRDSEREREFEASVYDLNNGSLAIRNIRHHFGPLKGGRIRVTHDGELVFEGQYKHPNGDPKMDENEFWFGGGYPITSKQYPTGAISILAYKPGKWEEELTELHSQAKHLKSEEEKRYHGRRDKEAQEEKKN